MIWNSDSFLSPVLGFTREQDNRILFKREKGAIFSLGVLFISLNIGRTWSKTFSNLLNENAGRNPNVPRLNDKIGGTFHGNMEDMWSTVPSKNVKNPYSNVTSSKWNY